MWKDCLEIKQNHTSRLSGAGARTIILKAPEAVLFDEGCNEQVFSPKSWKKKFGADLSCRFREKRKKKNAHFNSEKWRHWTEG